MFVILQHTVRNLHFLSGNSTLISRENCRFFWEKNSRNVVVLGFLAVDNFDFTRKIFKKKLGEKLVKMLGFCQNWFLDKNLTFRIVCFRWNPGFAFASGIDFSRTKIVNLQTFRLPCNLCWKTTTFQKFQKIRQINGDNVQRAPQPIQFPECFSVFCNSSKTRQFKVDYAGVPMGWATAQNTCDLVWLRF